VNTNIINNHTRTHNTYIYIDDKEYECTPLILLITHTQYIYIYDKEYE